MPRRNDANKWSNMEGGEDIAILELKLCILAGALWLEIIIIIVIIKHIYSSTVGIWIQRHLNFCFNTVHFICKFVTGFLAITFVLLFRTETFMMCVNVFYITRKKIQLDPTKNEKFPVDPQILCLSSFQAEILLLDI